MNSKLEERIKDNLRSIDVEAAYDEMLDECYDFGTVGGPFSHMQPSRVLANEDPTAYRCGLNDWTDGESRDRWVEVDGDYYDRRKAESERDDLVSELNSEVSDLEKEIEELEQELEDGNAEHDEAGTDFVDGEDIQTRIRSLKASLDSLNAEIREIENDL